MRWRRFRGGPGAGGGGRASQVSEEDLVSFSVARSEAVAELMAGWEGRLRGTHLFNGPIALEPEFLPFLLDDEAWERLHAQPHRDVPLAFVRLLVPVTQKVAPEPFAALLHALGALAHPLALEVVGTGEAITFQIVCASGEEGAVQEALRLAFPLSESLRATDGQGDALYLSLASLPASPAYRVIDLGLSRPTYEPLPLSSSWAPDPLLPLVGVLGSLVAGEVAGLQLLIAPARASWGEELAKLVALWRDWGDKDEPDARSRNTAGQEMEKALRHKIASPLWVMAPRVFAATGGSDTRSGNGHALNLCQRLVASLPGASGLLALDDEGYAMRDHLLDVLARRSRRTGAIVSAQELGALWHPPTESLLHPRLLRTLPPALPAELQELPGIVLVV